MRYRRYKLKRELPTFAQGDLFEIREDGCLYLIKTTQQLGHWKTNVVAYHEKTLRKFPNILKDWFEEVEDEPWRLRLGDEYFSIGFEGKILDFVYAPTETDRNIEAIGNCFPTREQAKRAVEWLKAFKVLKDDTRGYTPIWGDEENYTNWYVNYDFVEHKLDSDSTSLWTFGLLYFRSDGDAQESIRKHKKEWLVFLGLDGRSNG